MTKRKKQARPNPRQLKALYKNLITPALELRLEVLTNTAHWFDNTFDYIKSRKPTMEQLKSYEDAQKYRRQALDAGQTSDLELQEKALINMVACFEKACVRVRPPSLEKYLKIIDIQREKLLEKQQQLTTKYTRVLDMLLAALRPTTAQETPLKLAVDNAQGKERQFTGRLTTLTYSRQHAKKMEQILKRNGLMVLIDHEWDFIARACAHKPDTHGGFVIDIGYYQDELKKMYHNQIDYIAKTGISSKKLVRATRITLDTQKMQKDKGEVPVKFKVISADGVPKKAFGGRGEKLSGTWYTVGSAMALLFTKMKDGHWHGKGELQKLISADLEGRLRALKSDGPKAGKDSTWSLEFEAEKVKLLLS